MGTLKFKLSDMLSTDQIKSLNSSVKMNQELGLYGNKDITYGKSSLKSVAENFFESGGGLKQQKKNDIVGDALKLGEVDAVMTNQVQEGQESDHTDFSNPDDGIKTAGQAMAEFDEKNMSAVASEQSQLTR